MNPASAITCRSRYPWYLDKDCWRDERRERAQQTDVDEEF